MLGSNAIIARNLVCNRGLYYSGARFISSGRPVENKQRPVSPHLSIYEPQLTWVMSIFHRITGAGLAAGVYLGSLSYLSAGLPSSAGVVATVASMPAVVTFAGKALTAAPLAYHTCNGVRHLLWDFGYFLSLKQVYSTGYAVGGASTLLTLSMLLM